MNIKILALGFLLIIAALITGGCQKIISGTGYVYDYKTRQPIEGAEVRAYLDHPSPDALVMTTQTQANGSYYVYTQPYSCSGTCPKIVVEIIKQGYQSAIVQSPNNDTTFLKQSL